MKYTLAVLALLSYVSAEQIGKVHPVLTDDGYIVMKQEIGHKDKPSDEVANGDSAEDKELERVDDPNDPIAEDYGFGSTRNKGFRAQK